jgi:coproporphyrinogen III oxidase-like Fe-S oxidoreductase
MCEAGVSAEGVEARFGGSYRSNYATALARLRQLQDDGLIDINRAGDISVRPLGTVFLRHFAMAFVAYLDPTPARRTNAFSQTLNGAVRTLGLEPDIGPPRA